MLLVPNGKVQWDQDLLENSRNKLETAVKVRCLSPQFELDSGPFR